jgi:primary-amine oxidase
LDITALDHSNRERIPPPTQAFDFLPDLIAENDKNFKLRDDVKPLHIVQPEGVSFKMNGNELEWQKWKMHICEYGCLQGRLSMITLSRIQRSVIERGLHSRQSHTTMMESLGRSSTAFPWRRWLFHTQHLNTPTRANSRLMCELRHFFIKLFSLNFVGRLSGEYGLGTMANELALGCDCLGQIHYLVCFSHDFNAG